MLMRLFLCVLSIGLVNDVSGSPPHDGSSSPTNFRELAHVLVSNNGIAEYVWRWGPLMFQVSVVFFNLKSYHIIFTINICRVIFPVWRVCK